MVTWCFTRENMGFDNNYLCIFTCIIWAQVGYHQLHYNIVVSQVHLVGCGELQVQAGVEVWVEVQDQVEVQVEVHTGVQVEPEVLVLWPVEFSCTGVGGGAATPFVGELGIDGSGEDDINTSSSLSSLIIMHSSVLMALKFFLK